MKFKDQFQFTSDHFNAGLVCKEKTDCRFDATYYLRGSGFQLEHDVRQIFLADYLLQNSPGNDKT
jgi:hypothetical protein